MTDLTASAGQLLKAERERRGLSAQKAADELLLDEWVIAALEADDYQRVGAPVFAKGHLKRYAAFLGLPAEAMLAAYESSGTRVPRPSADTVSVRTLSEAPTVPNLSQSQMIGIAAALLLLAAVLWWKPWQRGARAALRSPAPASVPAPTGSAEPALPPAVSQPQPKGTPAPPAVSATAAAPAPAAGRARGAPVARAAAESADAAAGSGRARLRLSFSADSWVDIHDASGRRAFAGNGRANSVKTVAGDGPMRVYLGFASGVQLEINNRAVAIGPQFVAGDEARFEAGADGVLRRETHGLATPTAQTRNARPIG
jgi:cytoskeleton protein RodZ